MEEWLEKTLGELTSYITKGIPPKYVEKEGQETIRVLNQKCNRNYRISYSESRIHDNSVKKVPVDKMLKDFDVIINSTGTGTAGRIAQIWHVPVPTTIDGHMILMRPTQDIDSLYYGYAIKAFQTQIESFAEGSTGQTEINKRRLKDEIIIHLPVSLEKQKAIGRLLMAIDEKIELNEKINENLYEQMTAYYKHLFSNIISTTSVGEFADNVFSGGTPSTSNESYWNGTHYWLSSGETSERFIVSTLKTITDDGVANSSTRKAQKYDIVIASAGQGRTRGQTSMLLTDSYVNQSIIVVHACAEYLPYLFWNIVNRYEELRVISNSNSIRGSLTTKMISSLSIPKAGVEQIRQFSDYAWCIIKSVEKNLNENRKLSAIRDILLPKLMSGELDVSGLDL